MLLTLAQRRRLAGAFAICSLATLALLANHPKTGAGHSLADLILAEARDQYINGVVHGGFIATLAVLVICFVFLAQALGTMRVPVVVGLVSFCIGCGALMASMTLDGLVLPGLAARLTATGHLDDAVEAKTLLTLFGATLRVSMPTGLLFQGVAVLGWSWAIVGSRGWRLVSGLVGFAIGVLLIFAILATPPRMSEHVLLGGIVLLSIWYLALAGLLWAQGAWPSTADHA